MIYDKAIHLKNIDGDRINPAQEDGNLASSTNYLGSIDAKVTTLASATATLINIDTKLTDGTQKVRLVSSDGQSIDKNNTVPISIHGDEKSAFSRLRIADVVTLFDANFEYDTDSARWDTLTTGEASATYLPNEQSIQLSVGSASGDSCVRSTRQYFRYQPGKSQLIFTTGLLGVAKTNVRRRVGYFDAQNGIFLEQDGATLSLVLRSYTTGSVVETKITQDNWNIDKLNGTGLSAITIDISKAQILIIDLQWLGVGRVRVGFDINGIIIYAHEFLHANLKTEVYMTTATLPIRYEITNTDTTSSTSTMKQICCSVQAEGGYSSYDAAGNCFAAASAEVAISTNWTPIIAIRPALTFNGKTNRISVYPTSIDLSVTTGNVQFGLFRNPTISGGNWVSYSDSVVEYNITASSTTGGTLTHSGFQAASKAASLGNTLDEQFKKSALTTNAAGTARDVIVLAVKSLSGSAAAFGMFIWKEMK